MKKLMPVLFALSALLMLGGCQKEDPSSVVYQGCCDDAPVSFEVGAGRIFVPNVFTPNLDGINDVFGPFSSEEIEQFISMEIFNRSGESIYKANPFAPNEVYNRGGWNGISRNNNIYEGQFSYRIEALDIYGARAVVHGQACVLFCENPVNIDPTLCAFPLQHNGSGKLAASLPSGEEASACFE